jgi:hypothetical protein
MIMIIGCNSVLSFQLKAGNLEIHDHNNKSFFPVIICLRPAVVHDTIINLYRTTHSYHCMRYKIYTLRYQMLKLYYLLYIFRVKYPSSGVTMTQTF